MSNILEAVKKRMTKSEPESEAILKVEKLYKNYQGPRGTLKILRGVNLEAQPGEMVFILGRSGSGKSTLLQVLGGLDAATSGNIYFRGQDIAKLSEPELCEFRNKRIGFVFQFFHLLPELTLMENVMLPGLISGKVNQKRVKYLIDRVGLSHRKDHYPSQLSGGEGQRTAIARALANDADLILCDEPTGNLDEETALEVFELLVELNKEEKKTFLIVTHEASLIKRNKSVYQLHDGILKKE